MTFLLPKASTLTELLVQIRFTPLMGRLYVLILAFGARTPQDLAAALGVELESLEAASSALVRLGVLGARPAPGAPCYRSESPRRILYGNAAPVLGVR